MTDKALVKVEQTIQDTLSSTHKLREYEPLDVDDYLNYWVPELKKKGKLFSLVEKVGAFGEAIVLFIAREKWDSPQFPDKVKKKYKHSFVKFAHYLTQGLDSETIGNRIRVAETYHFNSLQLQEEGKMPVDVPLLEDGNQVVDSDTGEIITQPFDPSVVGYSKLLIARHTVEAGKMDDTGWEILIDPDKSVDDLRQHLFKKDIEGENRLFYKFDAENKIIAVEGENQAEIVLEVNWATYFGNAGTKKQQELVKVGINKICRALGIPTPDDFDN
jgi:hypothetical protein